MVCLSLFSSKQCIMKQLLDSVFVISGIIKVSVSVISLSRRLRLITLTSTSIIPDITKTSSNDCLLSPQQSCPEPCWKFVLNRLNILAILHIANTLWLLPTPPSPTPKKENKKVHKHCFCLAWDVRLSYCDTEGNFLLFFR